MKVFQIGFNKCGTSSIHERLERLGLKSIHHGDGKLARAIDENVKAGRPVLTGIEGYDAYTDLVHLTDTEHVEGFKYFREIERDVPDARFILNIRTKEKWLRSCRNHPRFLDRMMSVYGYTAEQVMEHWSADWDRHLAAVREGLPAEKLLIYDIETDPATKIDDFLGIDAGLGDTLGRSNVTPSALSEAIRKNVPIRVRHIFPPGFRENVRYLLRRRR